MYLSHFVKKRVKTRQYLYKGENTYRVFILPYLILIKKPAESRWDMFFDMLLTKEVRFLHPTLA